MCVSDHLVPVVLCGAVGIDYYQLPVEQRTQNIMAKAGFPLCSVLAREGALKSGMGYKLMLIWLS